MDNLKKQTTNSFAWNFADKVGYQVIALVVGLITLRLLSPTDFGYTGALAVFTMLSNILVESGFTAALIRRKNNTERDYTAAFWFNIALSVALYLILYFSAGAIATYFKMEPLRDLARILFLAIIFNSFTIVQYIILQKELKFKQLTIADLTGMIVSAIITIWMAMDGWGYWALAAQQISQVAVKAILLWVMSPWRPVSIRWGDLKIIKEIFSFSALLILSSAITTVVKYIYTIFIGPRYSTDQVGYYSQAYKYHQIPYSVISQSISGVAYPVLSSLNDERERQMSYIHRIMKMTAFFTLPVMAGFYAVGDNFVHVIITDKWLPMLPYLRLLLIAGTMMPFITQYLGLLNVFGKPNLYFVCEFVRNLLVIGLLLVMNDSITEILYGFIIATAVAFVGMSVLISWVTHYRIIDQVRHIVPPTLLALTMGVVVYFLPRFVVCVSWLQLLLQLTVGVAVYMGLAWIFRMEVLMNIKETIRHRNA